VIRIAAAGDIHASEEHRRHLTQAFSEVKEQADLVLLAGDVTTFGLPEEAGVLAEAARAAAPLPVVAVLGNHDYHSGRAEEVADALSEGGIVVLERGHLILDLDAGEVGIAGTKGFVGGFEGAEIPDFGEPLLRAVFAETSREVEALDEALEAIAGYAPTGDTVVGEPPGIWAFLGSRRLAGPIGAHRPDAVFHGHAHHGTARACIGEVPVWNVARHVTDQDFALIEV
jgi:uncharacterized protein